MALKRVNIRFVFVFFSLILIIFRVLTINTCGLNIGKLDLLADYVNSSNIDVCFIQETLISQC